MLVGIIVIGLIIYGFYVFTCKPYKDGEDPIQKFWDRGGWTRKETPPATTNLAPSLLKYKIIPITVV